MKILRVIATMAPSSGGPCQGVRNIIPVLEQLGVSNEVVSLDDPNANFIKKDTFTIHALGPAKGPWSYSSKLIPWLIKNLKCYDVVIIHGLWLFHGYAVRKAIESISIAQKNYYKELPRVYVMPHGMLDPYFQRASDRRLKAIRNFMYWKLIEARLINRVDGILFTCETELLLARVPFRPYHPKCELNIGYGIANPPAYTSAMRDAFFEKCPAARNRPYILFLSRIQEKKGVDMLIKAYKKVYEDNLVYEPLELVGSSDQQLSKESNIPILVIAGPGAESQYGQKILQLVNKTSKANSTIYFPGMLTGNAKWGAFYGCEAFVLPSHQENFGIAVVEALACSKPVLISNQVNIWREIKAAGGGIVSDDTQYGTQELLEKWDSTTNEEKIAMGVRARNSFEKDFAIKPAANRLLKVLNSMFENA